eukprot:SAG31_NODE_120_length_23892_cov_10.545623_6_plen_240_part_00
MPADGVMPADGSIHCNVCAVSGVVIDWLCTKFGDSSLVFDIFTLAGLGYARLHRARQASALFTFNNASETLSQSISSSVKEGNCFKRASNRVCRRTLSCKSPKSSSVHGWRDRDAKVGNIDLSFRFCPRVLAIRFLPSCQQSRKFQTVTNLALNARASRALSEIRPHQEETFWPIRLPLWPVATPPSSPAAVGSTEAARGGARVARAGKKWPGRRQRGRRARPDGTVRPDQSSSCPEPS